MIYGLRLGLLLVTAALSPARAQLTPYSSSYEVQAAGMNLGTGGISLSTTSQEGCYYNETTTRPIGIVRFLYGSPREASSFCVVGGVIRSSRFEYITEKQKQDEFTVDFDWAGRSATVTKQGTARLVELPDVAYDRLSLREAARLWLQEHAADAKPGDGMDIKMIDDGGISDYRFSFVGPERVETRAGYFDALRMDRTDNPRRVLRAWFAPSRGYTIVKLEQVKITEKDGVKKEETTLRLLLR
jgi:hypothetical protein